MPARGDQPTATEDYSSHTSLDSNVQQRSVEMPASLFRNEPHQVFAWIYRNADGDRRPPPN